MAEVKSKPLAVGYTYHFNIIYHHDRDKMASNDDTDKSLPFAMEIVKRLSQMGYDESYYYDRDSIPGRNMFHELFRVIKGSEWTIVILTADFMKNCWSAYSRMAAFKTLLDKENSHRLIPLALDLPKKDKPEELTAHDILYFPNNWQIKSDNQWNRLFKVFENKVPLHVVNKKNEGKAGMHFQETGGDILLTEEQQTAVTHPVGQLSLDNSQTDGVDSPAEGANMSREKHSTEDVVEQSHSPQLNSKSINPSPVLNLPAVPPATGQVSTATPTSALPAPDGRSQRSTVGPTPANLSAPDGPTNLSAPNSRTDVDPNVEAPRDERSADEQMHSISADLLTEEYGSITDGRDAMVDVKQAKTQSCDTNNSNCSNGVQLGIDTVDTAEEVIASSKQNDAFAGAAATNKSLSKDNDLDIDMIPSCRLLDDKMVTRRPETLTTASATGVRTNSTITPEVQQSTGPNIGSHNISPAPELGHNDLDVEDVPTLNPETLMYGSEYTPSDRTDLSIQSEHQPGFSSLVQGQRPQEGSSVMEDTIQPDTSFAQTLLPPDLNLSAERVPERPMTIGAEGGDLQSNEPSSTAVGVKGGTTPVTAGGGSNNDTARQTFVRPETSPDEFSLKGSSSTLLGKPQRSLVAKLCLTATSQFFNPFSSSSFPRY